jgi:carboxypeptidase C (cathepsin A)
MRRSCLVLVTLWSVQAVLAQDSRLPVDTTITSRHEVTIKGQHIPYTATVGTQPVWGDDGSPIASLLYTFYERTDVTDRVNRPLVISFNGGPGSASVWMHVGYTGPKQLLIDDEGFPIQPYGVRDNPSSILDVADIVFVNPVNVGFSRIVGDAERAQFFGVNEDIAYLAGWIETFVTRQNRWRSPKFLIGESYGTTRVSGLAGVLQDRHWMFLNGVILVSPTGLGVDRDGPVGIALNLPYFAAAAWYHGKLDSDLQARDLDDLLAEVEGYTIDTLLPMISRGGSADPGARAAVARQSARYSGVSADWFLDRNMEVSAGEFWKELLRDEGYTIGRLDSRYKGVDRQTAGDRSDYNQELTSWNHAFAPAINYYLREELGFHTDLRYWVFGPVSPWNRDGDNTAEQLRSAMAKNANLHMMVQSGFFDGATQYFAAKYTMWQMDPSGRLADRMRFEGYRSGHMMYLRAEDLVTSNEDIREFIADALETAKTPAKN